MTTSLPDLDSLAATVRAAGQAAQSDPSQRAAWVEALLEFAEALHEQHELEDAASASAEAMRVVAELVEEGRADELLAVLEIVARLARRDPVRHLPLLARLTQDLGRCYQQARRFDRAAAAFEQAVSGFEILARAQPHAHGRALIQAMSNHALSLAQSGELERAHAVALATVAQAEREPGWGLLPLLAGMRRFLADLAADLGRPEDALEHLLAGVRLLRAAITEQQPGAVEAAAKLGASLRELCEAHGFALPADVAPQ